MNRQKRVLAIHDISCIGKCSLTVAIPIISAAELECAVIPTAVLSTHTGEFTGYTFRDLTDDIEPICEHWRSFGIGFDAIYTGYLGSAKQISLVRSIIDTFGGEGKTVFGRSRHGGCRTALCEFRYGVRLRDALALRGGGRDHSESHRGGVPARRRIPRIGLRRGIYKRKRSARCVSSVRRRDAVGCIVRGREDRRGVSRTGGDYGYFADERIPGFYHGTGDVFASALVAAYVRGMSMSDAAAAAGALYDKKHPVLPPRREARRASAFGSRRLFAISCAISEFSLKAGTGDNIPEKFFRKSAA